MVPVDDILAYTDELARRFKPQRIVLFGSYAYGRPNRDSDVDLLVVKNYRGPSIRQAVRIRQQVTAPFALDLLVRSAAEIRRRVAWNDFFLKEVTDRGIVLYAADDARMGAEGRRRLRRRHHVAAVA